MNRQDYIIAKLTDTQVEVRPSVSVQKALRDSMAELAKEVRLAASYGELSESLQQRIEHVMRFFLALGEPLDAPTEETSPRTTFFGRAGSIPSSMRVPTPQASSRWDAGRAWRQTSNALSASHSARSAISPSFQLLLGRRPWSQAGGAEGKAVLVSSFPASWWANRHRGWRR